MRSARCFWQQPAANKQLEWMVTFWRWENQRTTWLCLMARSLTPLMIPSKQSKLPLRGAFASLRRKTPGKLCRSIRDSVFVSHRMSLPDGTQNVRKSPPPKRPALGRPYRPEQDFSSGLSRRDDRRTGTPDPCSAALYGKGTESKQPRITRTGHGRPICNMPASEQSIDGGIQRNALAERKERNE